MSYEPPPSQRDATPPPAAPAQFSPDGRWYWDGQRWQPVGAPRPAWARPFTPSDGRSGTAVAFAIVATAAQPLFFLGYLLIATAAIAGAGSSVRAVGALVLGLGDLIYVIGLVGAAITVPMWMHRAFSNLPALGAQGLRWSPGWAAGGWFIPFANFVIPFLVMRELRSGSGASESGLATGAWWALWIAGGVLSGVASPITRSDPTAAAVLGLVYTPVYLVAGILFINIVRQITSQQRARFMQLGA